MDDQKLAEAKASLGAGMAFPIGEPNPFGQYFVGQSYLAQLTTERVGVNNVTFEPGCRNNWHVHHGAGQILITVGGRGWYQEWSKPAVELKPGVVVNIPPEVKHWHGAAKDSWMAHIAFSEPVEGATNEWLEPVDDEQYAAVG